MMNLSNGTILGTLVLDQVIEYYDFPRLFLCHNSTGQAYIGLSIYDDDDEFHWIYMAISSARKSTFARGDFSLLNAFQNPESGYLFKVITYADNRTSEVELVLPEQISQDDLPEQSYKLKGFDQDVSIEMPSVYEVANATHRETFDYRIFAGRNIHEVPARKLGEILTVTQELVDALGQAAAEKTTVRGAIPVEILSQTRLNVTHTFQGSFGVQFSSSDYSDLLNNSLIARALEEFSNIILAQDSEDLLSNKLHSLRGRVTSKYRRLLKELADINSGLFFEWGSVNPNLGGKFELTSTQVKNAYTIVDRMEIAMAEEITITGKLIGFNSRTRRYEIMSSDDGRTYAGKVLEEAILEIPNPAIGQFYEVDLRMLIETQSTSGDELIRWVLVRLGPMQE